MSPELPSVDALGDIEFLHQMVEMNEALTLGAVRQHELTEAAESLNGQLRTEIIDRTHAESAARVSEERFRVLFELGPVAVYSCDVAGVIQEFNAGPRNCGAVRPNWGIPTNISADHTNYSGRTAVLCPTTRVPWRK